MKPLGTTKNEGFTCTVQQDADGRVFLPSGPRAGGTDKAELLYELWPGVAAPGFVLQKAH